MLHSRFAEVYKPMNIKHCRLWCNVKCGSVHLLLVTDLADMHADCKPAQNRLARTGLLESLLGLVCNHHVSCCCIMLSLDLSFLALLSLNTQFDGFHPQLHY